MEGSAMKHSRINTQRRGFLKAGLLALAVLALGTRTGTSNGQETKPRLNENDEQAEKLGYRHDATTVDKKKSPTYKPGDTCGNCQLFQGKAGTDEWAPCPIFPGKQVSVHGWCSSYMKKVT
jgi:hypothetical protein